MVPESREDLPLKGVRVLELAGLAPGELNFSSSRIRYLPVHFLLGQSVSYMSSFPQDILFSISPLVKSTCL